VSAARRASAAEPRAGADDRLDVAGIGSMVVDRLYRAPRILREDEKAILRPVDAAPGAGVCRRSVGGVVLNHLGWAATLGLRTGIFGKQADDENGRFLRDAMDQIGIEHHFVLDGSASSEAQLFVDDAGGRAIYMAPGATSETTAEHVRRHHAAFLRRARRVTTEVSQLPLDAVREVLRLARAAGIPTVVDLDVPPSDAVPGLGDEAALDEVLRAATLLKPAKRAARELVPKAGNDALALARALRERFGVGAVVLTDADAGCAIAAEGFEGRIAAPAVKTVDTTGAGDAFLGGLLAGLELGLDWAAAARLANACGAACVEQLGAFPEDVAAARARVLELHGTPLSLRPLPRPRLRGGWPDGGQAVAVIDAAADALAAISQRADRSTFEIAARVIREAEVRGGRVHVTGVGKSGHVARYAAALLASTGTAANFYDANESIHGSSGQVVAGDVVIAVSNSGETEDLHAAVEVARKLGGRIVAVTGGLSSWLSRNAEVTLDAGVRQEGGGLGLAPRASVAAQAMVLAGLAAVLEQARGFTRADFHARHPAGALGRRTRDPEPGEDAP